MATHVTAAYWRSIHIVCMHVYNLSMSSDEIIKLLKTAGWRKAYQKGSHTQWVHGTIAGKITVPHPKKDLPIGTVNAILKQAGVKK